MHTIGFSGLGTAWSISIDAQDDRHLVPLQELILERTFQYEQQLSRFIASSEVSQFKNHRAGTYQVSPVLAELLQVSDQLRTETNGRFDPAMGGLLERAGYDAKYSLTPAPEAELQAFKVPLWSIDGNRVTVDGPVVFDIGGVGKGYWIDQVAQIIKENEFPYFLVEGGGDMVATTKADGSAWQVAIEWPGRADTAIGVVALANQGLAVSDTFKRRWKKWHHLVDGKTLSPMTQLVGCAVVAPSAFVADQMTSLLSFSDPTDWSRLAKKYQSVYLVVSSDEKITKSQNWAGEIFE